MLISAKVYWIPYLSDDEQRFRYASFLHDSGGRYLLSFRVQSRGISCIERSDLELHVTASDYYDVEHKVAHGLGYKRIVVATCQKCDICRVREIELWSWSIRTAPSAYLLRPVPVQRILRRPGGNREAARGLPRLYELWRGRQGGSRRREPPDEPARCVCWMN